MIKTPDLIDSLASEATPVKRLRPPLLRALIWLAIGVGVLAIVGLIEGFRPDLATRLHQMSFDANVAGAALTGVLAAIACFMLSLPDRSRLWTLLPLPALILWMSTLGYQCLTDWVSIGPNGIQLGESVDCFVVVALTSLPLLVVLLVMLRHAAPLRPISAIITGSLAVAAISATAHLLIHIHEQDATIMIILWNLGLAALFVLISYAFGGRIFSWMSPKSRRHPG
ncbi:MAG TPA: DUF1109 domain-containing protein [Alphaproteobacteria bacterium]|nr:DUF1109 domain-containing protein [Alphaproteobacteria bacterium]